MIVEQYDISLHAPVTLTIVLVHKCQSTAELRHPVFVSGSLAFEVTWWSYVTLTCQKFSNTTQCFFMPNDTETCKGCEAIKITFAPRLFFFFKFWQLCRISQKVYFLWCWECWVIILRNAFRILRLADKSMKWAIIKTPPYLATGICGF